MADLLNSTSIQLSAFPRPIHSLLFHRFSYLFRAVPTRSVSMLFHSCCALFRNFPFQSISMAEQLKSSSDLLHAIPLRLCSNQLQRNANSAYQFQPLSFL
jgi:hypothetical protein